MFFNRIGYSYKRVHIVLSSRMLLYVINLFVNTLFAKLNIMYLL